MARAAGPIPLPEMQSLRMYPRDNLNRGAWNEHSCGRSVKLGSAKEWITPRPAASAIFRRDRRERLDLRGDLRHTKHDVISISNPKEVVYEYLYSAHFAGPTTGTRMPRIHHVERRLKSSCTQMDIEKGFWQEVAGFARPSN